MKITNPSEGVTIALTDPILIQALETAAPGALGEVSDSGHRHGIDLSDFLLLAGAQTTEATSTSTSAIDLLELTGLTIPAATPFLIVGVGRQSAGAVQNVHLGLSINGTVVAEATTDTAEGIWHTNSANAAQDGVFFVVVGSRVTNYLHSAIAIWASSGVGIKLSGINPAAHDATIPNAEVTSIEIRGLSDNALITMGCDEVRIYELPVT